MRISLNLSRARRFRMPIFFSSLGNLLAYLCSSLGQSFVSPASRSVEPLEAAQHQPAPPRQPAPQASSSAPASSATTASSTSEQLDSQLRKRAAQHTSSEHYNQAASPGSTTINPVPEGSRRKLRVLDGVLRNASDVNPEDARVPRRMPTAP